MCKRSSGRAGQAIIMVTVGTVFLCSLLGLVVDVGYGYYLKQVAQAAVDSAAMAAAVSAQASGGTCSSSVLCQQNYTCPSNPTSATNFGVGCLYGQHNGTGGPSTPTVTLSSGTGTTAGVNANYWVQATASYSPALSFLRLLGYSSTTVQASATAGMVSTGGTGGCIYVLDPHGSQSMNVSGGANIYSNCGIYVNSNASNALTVSGGAVVTGSVVDVVGNASISGGSTVTPSPTTGVSTIADPLASLPAPAYSGCNYTNKNVSVVTATLSPGVYCGGITISGGANVTFTSGTYVLNGGGLNVSGNSVITGSGVFFYNTSAGYSYSPLVLSGGTGSSLSAPTSGTYQGILFFQDRNITSSAKNALSGGSSSAFSGSIYVPTATLDFSGGTSTSPLTMALVCNDLSISGQAYLAKDSTGTLTGMGKVSSALFQ